MTRHRHIRLSLYEFVRDELSPRERAIVEEHLQRCPACRRELGDIRNSVGSLGSSAEHPSDRLPDTYWNAFTARVEARLAETEPRPFRALVILESFEALLLGNRRWVFAAGGGVVLVGLLLFFLRPGSAVDTPRNIATRPPLLATADQRVDLVFRRSKALLVGLDNLRPASGRPLDLSTERHISRELVAETRALRNAPINPRSALVVRDLERILIELANTDDRGALPQMEIIRSGMRQENILFRLRMAEASRDTGGSAQTKGG